MVLLFSFLILSLKICVSSWYAGKCLFHSDAELPVIKTCSGKTNTALCRSVADTKEDLRELPSNLQNLCIQMDRNHSALAPDSFARFVSLDYLDITGCFSEIPPEAFNGLTNVTSLSLTSSGLKGCCEVALDFSRLPSLNRLFVSKYTLSLLAPNVFEMIPHLQKLFLNEVCLKDISEVLCRLANVKSLKGFHLNEETLNRLQYPNCSVFNTSYGYISTVLNIEEVILNIGKLEHVDEGALKVLGNLFEFSFGSKADFLKDLSLIGVHKINHLDVSVDVLNIVDLCTAAKLYSTESFQVIYETVNLPLTPTNISDGCEEVKKIDLMKILLLPLNLLDVYSFFQIFRNLTLAKIANHELRPNDFQSLCASDPQIVKQLSVMFLSSNTIDEIVSYQFMCFTDLETLDLSFNDISNIEDFAFIGLNNLKELYLYSNKLSYIYQHTFSGLYGLMVLDLHENPIIHIESNSFGDLINLSIFLLGDLNFPPDMSPIKLHLSDIFGIIPYNLSNILISSGLRPMQLVIGNTTLDQALNLHIKGQYVTIEDCNSSLLTSVVTLQIDAAYVSCGNEFIGKYVRSVVSLEFNSVFSDDIGDLSVINQLVHLKTLKLANIELTKQPNMAVMFHNLTKLQTLILANCRFFFLDGSLTKDLKALTGLMLILKDNVNVLQNLVEHLTSLKYLYLQGLVLYCSCDNAWLLSWVKNNRKVQVVMFKPTMKELQCLSDSGIDHLNFIGYAKENCSFEIEFVFFASTSAFLCIFIIVVLSYKFAGQYIAPFYHIASGWFREALRGNGKHQYRYDVFVSYSAKDEHWVMEELLPNLERRGPPFLRLCLHSRDFQLGEDIVENITDSIYASRQTLCLVSRNYLSSNWCSLEMQLATYRLQVEHRDILILVFLEMIPSRWLSSHHRLARLVKTRTYLDWPQDPEMHEAFWDRLWCKLSSNKAN
ncbi:toll-like receptor 13 [Megalobrama amblycephala]|uniref:toll-like receptor 13 n=1 Tax=Megalobrama amblycephala TaxID=75352 RepID=UPI0020146C9E|nr:toll-like receptor 13 [Megalobrama amblycephala]